LSGDTQRTIMDAIHCGAELFGSRKFAALERNAYGMVG
jgi:hypothetical protein